MSEDERFSAVLQVATDPEAGVLVKGGGGIRKLRVARRGGGKSGGYRVLTYYMEADEPVFLLAVLRKSRQANFTAAQTRELARLAKSIRDER